MKKKKCKKLGTVAIGAALAVSCVLSPIAAAEEAPVDVTETTTAIIQQAELEKAILNEILPVEPTTEETTTEPNTEGTTNPAPQTEETDKSLLLANLEDAEAFMQEIEPGWMTPESYQGLVDAIANAKDVLEDAAATQDEIDAANNELLDAIAEMEPTEEGLIGIIKLTITELDKQLTDSSWFTPELWQDYVDAKTSLENILADPNASIEDIAISFIDYTSSVGFLAGYMYENADALLKDAKAAIAKPEKYTEESLTAVKNAVSALEAVIADPEADLGKLKTAYDVLDEAVKALEKNGEPTTEEPTTKEPTTKPTTKPSTGDSDNPKTGDDRNVLPIGLTATASLAVMGAMLVLKKKKAGENE